MSKSLGISRVFGIVKVYSVPTVAADTISTVFFVINVPGKRVDAIAILEMMAIKFFFFIRFSFKIYLIDMITVSIT